MEKIFFFKNKKMSKNIKKKRTYYAGLEYKRLNKKKCDNNYAHMDETLNQ